jgi:hypothetical protein
MLISSAQRRALELIHERPRATADATRRGFVNGAVASRLVSLGYAVRTGEPGRALAITEHGEWALRQPACMRDYVGRVVRLRRGMETRGSVRFPVGDLCRVESTHRGGLALRSLRGDRQIRAVHPAYVDVLPKDDEPKEQTP